MTIANPEGYSPVNIFEMEGIVVDLDLNSIGKDVLMINAIQIQDPLINFEGKADGGSNMQTLLDNISSGSSEEGKASEGEETKMIINSFVLGGAKVKAISEMKPGEYKW